MDIEIVLFLLGYPLSIFSNISTDYIKTKLEGYKPQPLKDLFVKSFLQALNINKKKVDEIGRAAIMEVEKAITKDKERLFWVLRDSIGTDNSRIFELRDDELKNQMAGAILNEYNLANITLANSVLRDCLEQYEISFFSQLTEKEGVHFIINILKKLNSDVAKREDIENLRNFLVETWSTQRTDDEAIRDDLRDALYEELSNPVSRDFSDSIVDYMASLKKKVEQLTADQYQVIHHLRYKNRAIISGCAGSGKTLLAAEKAIRLDQAGIRTLILCHNPHLVRYVRSLVSGSSVDVYDVTSFVNLLIHGNSQEPENWNEYIEPLDEEIDVAFDLVNRMPSTYEAVIVDEGQDFRELWWLLIEAMLDKSKNRILYIFHDDNQALLPFRSKYPIEESPVSMSKNCRNGGNIFEVVRKFHPHSPLISQFLAQDGIAKITPFDDTSLRVKLWDALQDAYKYANHYQISVITNELSIDRSPINNFEFHRYPDLFWRSTVLNDLMIARRRLLTRIDRLSSGSSYSEIANRFGYSPGENLDEYFRLPMLSFELFPTAEDVDLVCKYARKLFPYTDGDISLEVSFRIENARLQLMQKKPPHFKQYISATMHSKLNYYSNSYWAKTLPAIKSLTRLVPHWMHTSVDENTIPVYSVDMFKGLEADAIVLFVNSMNIDLEKEMYVGSSRAIGYLNIIINKSVLAKMHKLDDRTLYLQAD